MDDIKIIELLFGRADSALEEVSVKYSRLYKGIIREMLSDECDVEECANDLLLALWNSIPPKKPDPLKPYVGAVARNIALNRLNERGAQKRGGEAWLVLEELSECLSDNSGEELGESFALREALNSFLASLDEKTRVIFMQRYFYTCTVREIAAARGLKESAVTMLLFRTRQKLREHLNREGFEL